MTWLEFAEVSNTGKTVIWKVTNADNGSRLGQVSWHGAWRQYCFFPDAGCVWNSSCLTELTTFIDEQMEARKK